VYLDHLDPLAFRGLFPKARVVADLHNVYSTLASRVATERAFPANLYLHNEARLLSYMEKQLAAAASVIMTVSETEQEYFQNLGGRVVRLVPNGVDCAAFNQSPIGRNHQHPTLLYLGALSWQPNAKAAEFMAREVMPRVLKERPDVRLQIVGRNPGSEVSALAELPNVEVHANVPDVGVYLEQASILAVPLDSGGGTRLKILEAFAAGLPVVSTPVGSEGINCRHGEHLWIAERDQFAEGILEALNAPQLAVEFAERGRKLAEESYDWSVIGKAACAAVAEAVR
jgi:polysaccharide biosynthesis protein PslH